MDHLARWGGAGKSAVITRLCLALVGFAVLDGCLGRGERGGERLSSVKGVPDGDNARREQPRRLDKGAEANLSALQGSWRATTCREMRVPRTGLFLCLCFCSGAEFVAKLEQIR